MSSLCKLIAAKHKQSSLINIGLYESLSFLMFFIIAEMFYLLLCGVGGVIVTWFNGRFVIRSDHLDNIYDTAKHDIRKSLLIIITVILSMGVVLFALYIILSYGGLRIWLTEMNLEVMAVIFFAITSLTVLVISHNAIKYFRHNKIDGDSANRMLLANGISVLYMTMSIFVFLLVFPRCAEYINDNIVKVHFRMNERQIHNNYKSELTQAYKLFAVNEHIDEYELAEEVYANPYESIIIISDKTQYYFVILVFVHVVFGVIFPVIVLNRKILGAYIYSALITYVITLLVRGLVKPAWLYGIYSIMIDMLIFSLCYIVINGAVLIYTQKMTSKNE